MSVHTISRLNVNENYGDGLWWLKISGEVQDSRNGQVIVSPGPVVNTYHNPRERVLFSEQRDANPFFHFFEAMWMLAGRKDLEYVEYLLPRMREFSDDGETLQGAYGHRWRHQFYIDQIELVIQELEQDPNSRRAVIQMWSADDLGRVSKDLPCNTQLYVNVRQDYVDMTITCRSNDAIWGAYGANVVHFSFLQEYIACSLRKLVGKLYQFSNNFHVYPGMPRFKELWENPRSINHYIGDAISPGPLLFQGDYRIFYDELIGWLEKPHDNTSSSFLSGVAYPMWQSFQAYKERDFPIALDLASYIDAPDWNLACVTWLTRRQDGS